MSSNPSSANALPQEVAGRLEQWHGLWWRSAALHYFVGVLGVAASSLAAIDFGEPWRLASQLLAALAAVCLSILGFVQPDRRYQKFVRAWRALDPVALKYKYGHAKLDEVFAAMERGESIITEYEQEVARHQVVGQEVPHATTPTRTGGAA